MDWDRAPFRQAVPRTGLVAFSGWESGSGVRDVHTLSHRRERVRARVAGEGPSWCAATAYRSSTWLDVESVRFVRRNRANPGASAATSKVAVGHKPCIPRGATAVRTRKD